MMKFWKKYNFWSDPIFWRRMFWVMLLANIIMFITWVISMVTITTSLEILKFFEQLLSKTGT